MLTGVVGVAFGQTATPTPAPTATPADLQTGPPENLSGVPAIAIDYRSDVRALPELGRVGVDMTQQRPLTLRDAVVMAMENNKDIEITRKGVTIAEFDLQAARGFYQTRLAGQTYYDRSTAPNVSIFSNNPRTTVGSFVGNAGLNAYLPDTGTIFSAAFNNSRLTSDNPISILSPQYNTGLTFNVTQPLFRGRKFDQPRRTIEIAKRNIALTDTQFRQRSVEVVAGVERAYWDLTYGLRNLQVQRDALADARRQLEHNRRLVEEGQLAPIDVVAAETQVANFEGAVYDALAIVNTNENALKNLIAPNRTGTIWNESITPVESVEVTVPRINLNEATDLAIANRPELEINEQQREINAIDQRFFREHRKPQIDLVASYGTSGIGGGQNPNFNPNFPTACNAVPPNPTGCAQQQANLALLTGNPLGGLFTNRYPTLRFGINFSLPLFGGDRTASANLGRARVEAERLGTQREQIEQNIQVDVRNALQAIRTGEARLRSAAVARENSVRQLESEQRKLTEGQSDVYRVLERQTALAAARANELRARTELNKSIADLDRATGNSLKAKDIVPKR